MWTIFLEEPDPAIAVAERDEILARQSDAHRRAIRARRSRAPARPGSSSAASHRPSLSRVRSGSAAGFPHVKASSFLLPQSRRSSRPFARSRKRCRLTRGCAGTPLLGIRRAQRVCRPSTAASFNPSVKAAAGPSFYAALFRSGALRSSPSPPGREFESRFLQQWVINEPQGKFDPRQLGAAGAGTHWSEIAQTDQVPLRQRLFTGGRGRR
jgi:hypothetical protein